MNLLALNLVLAGSLLHLGWNGLAKNSKDKLAFLWLTILPSALIGTVALGWQAAAGNISLYGALCISASGLVHAYYFRFLAGAYQQADLSFVYPYCRGIGALLATLAAILLLGESPVIIGWIGIGLTLSATFVEAVTQKKGTDLARPGLGLTLLTGCAIAAYSFIDKLGVSYVHPLLYLPSILIAPAVILAPGVLRGERLRTEFRHSGLHFLTAAFFLAAAYGVVLQAMKIAPLSYVVAARATGIMASGAAGIYFFKEKPSAARWAAIAMIAAGVACIGLA